MKNLIKIVLVIIVLSFGYVVVAQGDSEVNVWSSVGVKYQPDKNWELGVSANLRLKDNSKTIDNYFPELTVSRKIYKGLKLGVGFRYIRNNDNQGKIQGYENHFRFNTDLSYKHKINDFTLNYRIRYQNKNELGVSNAEGDYAINRFRFKVGSKYNIKKWPLDPELSFELFNRFGKDVSTDFDKYRLTLGTSYKIKNGGKIKLYYRLEKDILETSQPKTNIIGVKYTYIF